MKLLLFSDLHCDARAAHRLVERSAAVDVVVGAGDFANLRRGIERTLDVFQAIDKPAVLDPGNSESDAELAAQRRRRRFFKRRQPGQCRRAPRGRGEATGLS